MVAEYVAGLHLPISEERLESYRPQDGTDLDMVVCYLWNVKLSEALYPALQAFEVSLRNSIHAAATARYGTEFWFDQRDVLLSGQRDKVQDVKDKLTENGKPHTAGRIVAGLMLGFWISLLNRPYERPHRSTSAARLTWHDATNRPMLLLTVFPHATKRFQSRGQAWQRCEEIRLIRNRVFHYEPIWNRPALEQEYRTILETIEWISPDMRQTVRLCDNFPTVIRRGKADVRGRLTKHILLSNPTPEQSPP